MRTVSGEIAQIEPGGRDVTHGERGERDMVHKGLLRCVRFLLLLKKV